MICNAAKGNGNKCGAKIGEKFLSTGKCGKHQGAASISSSSMKKSLSSHTGEGFTDDGNKIFKVRSGDVDFNVVIVPEGGTYQGDSEHVRINSNKEDIAVIYDSRYVKNFTPEGQQVSWIGLRAASNMRSGWVMDGGVKDWTLDAEAMRQIGEHYEPKTVELNPYDAPTADDLLEALGCFNPYLQVRFEDGSVPQKVISWRGDYSQMSLSSKPSNQQPTRMTVNRLKGLIKDSIGKPLTGYNGGEFTAEANSFVYCDNYGEANGRFISGITSDGILLTSEVDY